MKRKASTSHDEATIRELRKSPEFAAEYLRAALEDADEPRVLLIALRRIAKSARRHCQGRGDPPLRLCFCKGGEPRTHAARASVSSSPVPTEIQDLAGIRRIHRSQAG